VLTEEIILQRALDKYYEDDPPDKIPESLPLVEEFCGDYLLPETFRDLDAIFIQHHLGPFIPRITAMSDCGLEMSKCWVVDIPYSTNKSVRKELTKLGVPSEHMVTPFDDPIEPFSRRQIERVEFLISSLVDSGNSKILVVDDGAYFLRALNHMLPRNKKLVSRFKERGTYLVEQTTRGHRYLETEEANRLLKFLNIPAVSIARASTKYRLESPFIGASVSMRMIQALRKSGHLTSLGNVFVLGFGAVGKAVTREVSKLKLDNRIDVYDVKWKMLDKDIKNNGAHPLSTFPKTGPYDTILGCTGKTAVHKMEQLKILRDNAVLVSCSSAAIEFNREGFLDLAYKDETDDFFVLEPEKTRKHGIHASIRLNLDDKKFSFLNAGFPVNFDGSLECLPALIIQPTHGMLIAAAHETFTKDPGLHCLRKEYDDWFYTNGLAWIKRYADMV
jgi:S-adenosylhomocysteine hydrolase